jgi:hypothetical protein
MPTPPAIWQSYDYQPQSPSISWQYQSPECSSMMLRVLLNFDTNVNIGIASFSLIIPTVITYLQ